MAVVVVVASFERLFNSGRAIYVIVVYIYKSSFSIAFDMAVWVL